MLLNITSYIGLEGRKRIFLLLLFCVFTLVGYGQGCSLSVEAGQDVPICSGNPVQLKAIVTGAVGAEIHYTWTPATELSNAAIANPIAHPTATTHYKVTVENKGCTVSDEITVVVNIPPVVDFSFTNNTCSGFPVQFTSSVGGEGPFTYNWNFGDLSAPGTTANPIHTFETLGCGISTFVVILTVTDSKGCQTVKSYPVLVKQKPDIDFQDIDHPFEPFSNCSNASASNPVYSIRVGNISNSTCIASYSIDWGDGNSQSNITFPLSHAYNQLGAFEMIITATGSNGCSNSKQYTVKNISNPSGGINSPGSTTNLCAPTDPLQFEISKWGTNSPGTSYEIDFGDGSGLVELTHEELMKSSYYNAASPADSRNFPVPHSYTLTSCHAAGGLFTVTLRVTNACGETKGTVSNISIVSKPTAAFDGPSTACVNTSVTFINTTDPGNSVNCSPNALYTWDFGDGSPVVTSQDTKNVSHQYRNPGMYEVILTVQSLCGVSPAKRNICIVAPLAASFDLSALEGCAPMIVFLTSTTDISQSCSDLSYNWQISPEETSCDISGNFIFLNGTNTSSRNPFLMFPNSGTYTIKLTVSNACGAFSIKKTIKVKKPPRVAINSIAPLCLSFPKTTITPTADISTCGSGNITYQWSFPGGSPTQSDLPNPVVTYDDPGNYSISLKIIGDCGSATASTSLVINPSPQLAALASQAKCRGEASDPVSFESSLPNTIFKWTNSNPLIGLAVSGTGNISSFIVENNTTSVQMATITVTPQIAGTGCMGPSKSFIITVNPTPTVNSIPDLILCNGSVQNEIQISGGVAGTLFKWKNSNPEMGLPEEGVGNIPSFTAKNQGTEIITALITVTPSTNGCTGLPMTFRIRVKPTPDDLIVSDKEFCTEMNSGLIDFNSVLSETSYSWTNTNTAIGLKANGTGNLPFFVTQNSGSNPISSIITVRPNSNGCEGATKSFTLKVQPDPKVEFSLPNQILCSGNASNAVDLTSPTPDVLISWIADIPTGIKGAELTGTNSIPVQNLVNTAAAPLTITYHTKGLIPGSNCSGAESNYTISVIPKPKIADMGTFSICSGEKLLVAPEKDNRNILPDGTTYKWSDPVLSPASALISGATSQSSPSLKFGQTLINNSNEPITLIYTVTPSFQDCQGDPFKITIEVKPVPVLNTIQDMTLLSGQPFPGVQFQANVTETTYNWSCNQDIGKGTAGSGNIPPFPMADPGSTPSITTFNVAPMANGCAGSSKSFTLAINPPVADFEPDTSGCAPLIIKFRNYSKNNTICSWDFGNGSHSSDFEPTMTYLKAGIYTVSLKVFNQFGAMSSSERQIKVNPVPEAHFHPLNRKVKMPQAVNFLNNSLNADTYLWDFGDENSSQEAQPRHQYSLPGNYFVTLYITSRENCRDSLKWPDAVEVYNDDIRVANAFIPDKGGSSDGNFVPGDPYNRVFYPVIANGEAVYIEFLIYNRWGNLVFSSHEVGRGWDGYYNGRLCPQDVYVWKIRCTFRSGNTITETGDVTLIQ